MVLEDFLVRMEFSFDSSEHPEKPEHNPLLLGCNPLTPVDFNLCKMIPLVVRYDLESVTTL